MTRGFLFSLLFFFSLTTNVFCQSAEFTQVSTNLLYSNPAFAGTNVCPRLYLDYRNKFLSLGSAYQTFYASYDQHLDLAHGDIAVTAMRDVQAKGVITNTLVGLVYAKSVYLSSKTALKFGAEVDYFNHKVNSSDLSYPDMIDPFYGFVNVSQEQSLSYSASKICINAGLLLYSNKYFIGASIYNANQSVSPNANNRYLLQRRAVLVAGEKFKFVSGSSSRKILYELTPMLELQNESRSNLLIYGTNLKINKILLGVWGKQNISPLAESFSFLIGFVEKKYKFAYNCDVSISKISNRLFDSHEVSLTYYFGCVEHLKKVQAIKCPGI